MSLKIYVYIYEINISNLEEEEEFSSFMGVYISWSFLKIEVNFSSNHACVQTSNLAGF